MPNPAPLIFTALTPKSHAYAPTPASLSRANIPGGWLVYGTSSSGTASLVFVPDPNHEWDGGAGSSKSDASATVG